jgi:hypothetical protein
MIFLCIAYPMGRMSWAYKPPPDEETPLVLEVFNPTFWVMVEMCLGAWAANLPPLGPLLRAAGFSEAVNSAYRKLSWASLSRASGPQGTPPAGAHPEGSRSSDPEVGQGSETELVGDEQRLSAMQETKPRFAPI